MSQAGSPGAASCPLLPGNTSPVLSPPPTPTRRDTALLELLSNELLVVEVTQTLLLHQGALPLQRVLLPPRRFRHAHAQLRLGALQQRSHRLLVLELRDARMLAWTRWEEDACWEGWAEGSPAQAKLHTRLGCWAMSVSCPESVAR